MTAGLLLADLSRRGASVTAKGDRLRVEAPPGTLTPAIREALTAHKADLLRLLPLAEEYRTLLRQEAALRDSKARLLDELGPAVAAAIQQAA